mgnify:CR=1 FL=1
MNAASGSSERERAGQGNALYSTSRRLALCSPSVVPRVERE